MTMTFESVWRDVGRGRNVVAVNIYYHGAHIGGIYPSEAAGFKFDLLMFPEDDQDGVFVVRSSWGTLDEARVEARKQIRRHLS